MMIPGIWSWETRKKQEAISTHWPPLPDIWENRPGTTEYENLIFLVDLVVSMSDLNSTTHTPPKLLQNVIKPVDK